MSNELHKTTLAELAAEMGKTEDELKAWIEDTPRRRREMMERLSQSPAYRAVLAKYDHLARKPK